MSLKSIFLFFNEGSSDKVYNIFLEEEQGGYVVNFQYGRRGTSLTCGSKTSSPLELSKAEKIYNQLVKKQLGKRYQVVNSEGLSNDGGFQYVTKKDSNIFCQLSNSIDEAEAKRLLTDDNYISEVKYDGRRMLLRNIDNSLQAINRKGQYVTVPPQFAAISSIDKNFVIDGEDMGDHFRAFDILALGDSIEHCNTLTRWNYLKSMVESNPKVANILRLSDFAFTTEEKKSLLERVQRESGEGVVFKLKEAPYSPGRPASGGAHLKFKLYESASFIVKRINNKRSVLLEINNEAGALVEAGNVTIPANYDIPSIGDVVEVKYLYAFKESGSVFQPSYLGKRDDIDYSNCTVSQLKFKAADSK